MINFMKKIIFLVVFSVLLSFPALAAEQKSKVLIDDSGLKQAANSDDMKDRQQPEDREATSASPRYGQDSEIKDQPVQIQNKGISAEQVRDGAKNFWDSIQAEPKAETAQDLKLLILEKKQELAREFELVGNKVKQKVFKNQNVVREAVHALVAAENLAFGIGPQISAIAQEFNNSAEKIIQAEERIQARSKIRSFFFGGDLKAALELKDEIEKNKSRIQELRRLESDCDCEQEILEIIQEQVGNLEQEQYRLEQLARKQTESRGLFGILLSWFKR